MNKTVQYKLNTKIGSIFLVASHLGLQGVYWSRQSAPLIESLKGVDPEIKILAKAAKQLEEYLAGKRNNFDLPLDVVGTDFQKRVWNALSQIPYGVTHSYKDVAAKVGSKNAARAIGTANGKNPLSIIVPCHRVIAANGGLGGYAGGLKTKTRLLELEGASTN